MNLNELLPPSPAQGPPLPVIADPFLPWNGRWPWVKAVNVVKTGTGIWTGGGPGAYASCTDGTYIYVTTYASPAKVIKIDPTTMTAVATWTGSESYEQLGYGIRYYNGYIYLAFDVHPARATKINANTMVTDSHWVEAGSGLDFVYDFAFDDTYVYFGGVVGVNATIWKFAQSDITTILATWTSESIMEVQQMYFDGSYFYITNVNGGTNIVGKVNASTMATVTLMPVGDSTNTYGIDGDGTYIYVSAYGGAANNVYKIRTSDMTIIGSPYVSANPVYSIRYDSGFIYCGTNGYPDLVKVDVNTMTATVSSGYFGPGFIAAITLLGTHVYTWLASDPIVIKRLKKNDLTLDTLE